MSRRELYFWGTAIAICNVMARYIVFAFDIYDSVGAITTTFNVSVIVWALFYWTLTLLWSKPDTPTVATRRDAAIVVAAIIVAAAPLEYIGWIAVLIVGAGAWLTAEGDTDQRKAGVLLAGVTVPMFWTKMIFSVFSHYILLVDAMLVAAVTQTERSGNLVAIPAGGGYLQILGPCSSFANISLAYLGWLMALCYFDARRSFRLYAWCFAIVVAIIAINTFRIALIGFFPHHYELIHGEIGSTIIGWVYVVVIFGLSTKAIRSEPDIVARAQSLAGHDAHRFGVP